MDKQYTRNEEWTMQQFTGMHYSGGLDVQSVCSGMGLEKAEWENIKEDCSWLNDYEIAEIEQYLKDAYID